MSKLPIEYRNFRFPKPAIEYCYLHFSVDTGFKEFIIPEVPGRKGMDIILKYNGEDYLIKSNPIIKGRVDNLFEFFRSNPDITEDDLFDIILDYDRDNVLNIILFKVD